MTRTPRVLLPAMFVGTPYFVSKRKGGSVERHHVLHFSTETEGANIYYTIDGAAPELHKVNTKVGYCGVSDLRPSDGEFGMLNLTQEILNINYYYYRLFRGKVHVDKITKGYETYTYEKSNK